MANMTNVAATDNLCYPYFKAFFFFTLLNLVYLFIIQLCALWVGEFALPFVFFENS